MTLQGTYDPTLVIGAIVLAVFTSYTVFDLASRARASKGGGWWATLAGLTFGFGVWGMHFIGMLAYDLGVEVTYDVKLTMVSVALAVFASALAFPTGAFLSAGPSRALVGTILGLALVGMHYVGMEAMIVPAGMSYDPLLAATSITMAAAIGALLIWRANRPLSPGHRTGLAFLVGIGMWSMHWLGTIAAVHGSDMSHLSLGMQAGGIEDGGLAVLVAVAVLVVVAGAQAAAVFDRKFAELATREASATRERERYLGLLHQRTPTPTHSLDEAGVIEHVSDAWLDLLGYGREEVVGRTMSSFLHADSATAYDESSSRPEIDDEHRMLTRSGDVVHVVLHEHRGVALGGRARTLGFVEDLTSRRKTEAALRRTQRMDAFGQLTGGVALDFTNMLAVVLANLSLILERVPRGSEVAVSADNAVDAATRASALSQRMVEFARAKAGHTAEVDVENLVLSMSEMLRTALGPRVTLETYFPGRLPRVHVDPHQLETAIMNLTNNAGDAIADRAKGMIALSARKTFLDAEEAGRAGAGVYLAISVIDNGPGMDEATSRHAAEPFFTTKGPSRSAGLGLTSVYSFASTCGGVASHSSGPDGTTVTICLPIANARRIAEIPRSTIPAPLLPEEAQQVTVLVVDDNRLLVQAVSSIIEDLGHSAVGTNSGEEALAALRNGGIVDLVITDQAMPSMTGVELAAEIKREWPGMPVVLATGAARIPPTNDVLAVLEKPFEKAQVEQAIILATRRSAA